MTDTAETSVISPQLPQGPWALLSLLLGVLILSFAAILTRLAENELSVSATVFNRYFIATIALGCWQFFASRWNPPSAPPPAVEPKDRALFLLSSVLGTGAVSLWALSLTQTSVANSNLLHNVTPVFTVLGGWLFLGQRFDLKYLLGILLAIAGVAMISFADLQASLESVSGDSIALLSAVFYAFNYLTREKLRSKFPAIKILFWTCLLSSIYTFLLALQAKGPIFAQSWPTWLAVLSLAVFCQGIGQGLLVHNLKRFSAGFVTLLMLLEPLMTALFAAAIFSERLTSLNWVAFAIVLMGIYLARIGNGAPLAGDQNSMDLSEAD